MGQTSKTPPSIGWVEPATKIAWLDHNHPSDKAELDRAFNSLPGGPEAHNSEWGESWQYMGTVYGWQGRAYWVHQFRHRAHPDFDDERKYQNIFCATPRQELLDKAW